MRQDVPEKPAAWRVDLYNAGPTGRVVGGAEFGEAAPVVGAAGEDELAVGGEFEERAAGKA